MTAADLAGLSRRGRIRCALAWARRSADPADLASLEAVHEWLACPCVRHAAATHDTVSSGGGMWRLGFHSAGGIMVFVPIRNYFFGAGLTAAERQWRARALAVIRLGDTLDPQ